MTDTLDSLVLRDWERSMGFSSEDPLTVSMEGIEVPEDDSVGAYAEGVGRTWGEMLRGAVAGTLGAGGDIESIIQGFKSIYEKEAGEGSWDAFLAGMAEETILPTTQEVSEVMPKIPGNEELEAAGAIGEMLGPGGVINAGRAGVKAVKAAAKSPKQAAGAVAGAAVAPTAEGATQNTGGYRDTFVNYLMENENAAFASGKAKTARHKSPEGGRDTVGFGHKLTAKEEREGKIYGIPIKDIDVDKAKQILIKDIKRAATQAKTNLKSMHPNVDFDSLSEDKKEMLTDIQFNVKGGGIKTFPKFVQGLVTDDVGLMKKEYKRYYTTAKGAKREVKKRNTDFFNMYLKNL